MRIAHLGVGVLCLGPRLEAVGFCPDRFIRLRVGTTDGDVGRGAEVFDPVRFIPDKDRVAEMTTDPALCGRGPVAAVLPAEPSSGPGT
jgi:hypothetical protein